MTTSLQGEIALITGASRGIGRAITDRLYQAGAHIIPVARSSEDFDNLISTCKDRCTPWIGDATSGELLHFITDQPKLDILVNNVGTNIPKEMRDVDDETLDLMLNLNVRATYRISRAVIDRMPHGGRIINITSQMGHVGSPRRTVYCMTKHAIEGLTKAMAVELAPKGIRVNSVAPTFVETPMTRPMLADSKFADFVKQMIPLGQIAQPKDVADAVAYLAGPGREMVTGHSLVIDGGWTAH
ncbi:MAG: SDR family oxidoreductase [Pseudomonadota bacterium]